MPNAPAQLAFAIPNYLDLYYYHIHICITSSSCHDERQETTVSYRA